MISCNCSCGRLYSAAHRLQRLRHRVLWLAVGHPRHFLAPPGEFGRCELHVLAFIDHVIDLAAEGVQRGDRSPLRRWQEEEAVIEARTAAGGLLLAVFVGSHRQSQGCHQAVIVP
jgi:hypothetical protein